MANDETADSTTTEGSESTDAASNSQSDNSGAGKSTSKQTSPATNESEAAGQVLQERPDTDRAKTAREPPEESPEQRAVREAVLEDVVEYFETRAGADEHKRGPFRKPDTESLESGFFDFSYLEERQEVERYWVKKPFAYVSILYDEERRTYTYHVSEPTLDDFEQYLRGDLVRAVRNILMYREIDEKRGRREIFEEEAREIIADQAATVDPVTVQKLLYYLVRDFVDYGRIDPLMRDPTIEDISCDGASIPVFIYHGQYRDLRTNIVFDNKRLNSLVVRLAQRAGKHLSISDPLMDASLPNGSRIQLTLGGNVTSRGSNFTIRKFSTEPHTPVDLINWNTFSTEELAYLWLCIENNRSLIFAGGTGSGKTTSLNAVSFFIPPDSKIVTIEDTREISLPHDNWIQSLTRNAIGGRGEIGTYELLQAALRQRPEYLLVGEIRTEQNVGLTFFQAISTGHTCYTTVHADSIDGVLSRLHNPPLSVPNQMLKELDIISIQRQLFVGDQRVRRTDTIGELDHQGDDLVPKVIFDHDVSDDTHEKVGDSEVLRDVAQRRGWSKAELAQQLHDRERVLEYLVEQDVTDHLEVAAVIRTFQRNPDYVLDRIEADDLQPRALLRGDYQ